jgi:hypothetical protein
MGVCVRHIFLWCQLIPHGTRGGNWVSVRSAILELFFVKARSETSIIYHDSKMTQRKSRLVGKVVQPLQSVSNSYNNRAHDYE